MSKDKRFLFLKDGKPKTKKQIQLFIDLAVEEIREWTKFKKDMEELIKTLIKSDI